MAHIQTNHLKLWKPQDLTVDKISSQKMFVDNIDALEAFALSMLKRSSTPVATIDALRAINTSDTILYSDGMTVMVKSAGLYFFDRGNTTADDGKDIIMPTAGGGRWVSLHKFLGDLAFKDSLSKSDVGLGNVPNVATNDQTPTYSQSSTLVNLTSGEKLSISMGKIMKAIADLISHIANKSNPHAVTKTQVGLGNVDNTSDANKPISTATQAALSAINGNLCGSVQSIANLRAIDTSNTTLFKNGTLIMVQENGIYNFNRNSTADDDGNAIIAPTTGGGRWITTQGTDIAVGLRQLSNDNEFDSVLTTALTNMSNNSVKFMVIKTVSYSVHPFYGGTVHIMIHKVTNSYATVTGIVYNSNGIARQFTRSRYDSTWGAWTSLPFLDANGKIPLDQLPSGIMSASIE